MCGLAGCWLFFFCVFFLFYCPAHLLYSKDGVRKKTDAPKSAGIEPRLAARFRGQRSGSYFFSPTEKPLKEHQPNKLQKLEYLNHPSRLPRRDPDGSIRPVSVGSLLNSHRKSRGGRKPKACSRLSRLAPSPLAKLLVCPTQTHNSLTYQKPIL